MQYIKPGNYHDQCPGCGKNEECIKITWKNYKEDVEEKFLCSQVKEDLAVRKLNKQVLLKNSSVQMIV